MRDQLLIRRHAHLTLAEFHALSWDEVLMWLDVANQVVEEETRAAER